MDPEGRFTVPELEKKLKEISERLSRYLARYNSNFGEKSSELELSKIFDLNFKIECNGSNLSNGEKQILNIVRALITDAPIIFLDEATSNLDPHTGNTIYHCDRFII